MVGFYNICPIFPVFTIFVRYFQIPADSGQLVMIRPASIERMHSSLELRDPLPHKVRGTRASGHLVLRAGRQGHDLLIKRSIYAK